MRWMRAVPSPTPRTHRASPKTATVLRQRTKSWWAAPRGFTGGNDPLRRSVEVSIHQTPPLWLVFREALCPLSTCLLFFSPLEGQGQHLLDEWSRFLHGNAKTAEWSNSWTRKSFQWVDLLLRFPLYNPHSPSWRQRVCFHSGQSLHGKSACFPFNVKAMISNVKFLS